MATTFTSTSKSKMAPIKINGCPIYYYYLFNSVQGFGGVVAGGGKGGGKGGGGPIKKWGKKNSVQGVGGAVAGGGIGGRSPPLTPPE